MGRFIRGFKAKPVHAGEAHGFALAIEQAIALHVQEGGWWWAIRRADLRRVGHGRIDDRGILAARRGATHVGTACATPACAGAARATWGSATGVTSARAARGHLTGVTAARSACNRATDVRAACDLPASTTCSTCDSAASSRARPCRAPDCRINRRAAAGSCCRV